MEEKALTHGIGLKDKVGYALGDAGGLLTFSLIGSFLTVFYTDTLKIPLGQITVLMLVARIWDAINDPLWGAFIDSRKPTKYGRFRPYIFWFSLPMAVAAGLMFTKLPFIPQSKYIVYAYITYIFYGMMYTAVNIPYGSLASVITDDELERSSLSMWRSIGAGVGGLPGQILLPMFVYSVVRDAKGNPQLDALGNEVKVLNGNIFSIAVIVLAAISIFVYFLNFKMTKERITLPKKQVEKKYNLFKTIKDLFSNMPFVILCIVSMLLIAFQMYYQTAFNYLFKDYYAKPGLYAVVTVCTYGPMAIFLPFMGKLIVKFGKKELCAFGLGFAAIVNVLLFVIRGSALAHNPYVFLAFTFFSGMGQTFLVLEVWALVMDVIDYHELRTHRREEGTSYSLYSFTRKLGQTLAGAGVPMLLKLIGYDADRVGLGQSKEVLDKLYDISTLVPAITLGVMAILLAFFYSLSKKKLVEVHEELAKVRELEETE
ncbi:MAG: MFS transporter [Eubacterium sp.]|nr:MFS transporter [Eubacterium sp.]